MKYFLVETASLALLAALLLWALLYKRTVRAVSMPPPPKSDYERIREAEIPITYEEPVRSVCEHEGTQLFRGEYIVCANCGERVGKMN